MSDAIDRNDERKPDSLGLLEKLPLELRTEVFSYLPELRLSPALSHAYGLFWPQYFVSTDMLLMSRQTHIEVRSAFDALSKQHPPTVILTLPNAEHFNTLKDIIHMARCFDIKWLRTHDPAKETETVANWVIENPVRTYQAVLPRMGFQNCPSYFQDKAAVEWCNLRRFLGTLLLRLRIAHTLQVRVLMKANQQYGTYLYVLRGIAAGSMAGTESSCGYEMMVVRPPDKAWKTDLPLGLELKNNNRVKRAVVSDLEMRLVANEERWMRSAIQW